MYFVNYTRFNDVFDGEIITYTFGAFESVKLAHKIAVALAGRTDVKWCGGTLCVGGSMSNLKNRPKPEQESHPSYGMIGLSRTMNGTRATRLFGSALQDHAGTMRVTIKRAVREHDLHRDSYFAREELIEVELSSAQYVEMITDPNVSSGVPCTIRHINCERMPDVPDTETEVERVKNRFGADLQDMITVLKERRAEIEKLTTGLSAKARAKLRIELDVMIQQLTSNVPFVLEQFHDASEKVVTAAKHEIESFATSVLRAAGMEAIAEGRLPKALAGSVARDRAAHPVFAGWAPDCTCKGDQTKRCAFHTPDVHRGMCECWDGCGVCDGCGRYLAG